MKTTRILLRIIFFVTLISFVNQAFTQGKFEISGGLGWPEWSNLKIKYGQKVQIGVCQSFYIQSLYPDYKKKIYLATTSIELYYHFGGKSKFTGQPPWYLYSGIGCLWGHEGDENEFYVYPRLGRSI